MARKHFESHTDLDKNVTTTSDQRPLALPEKLRAVRGFLKIKTEWLPEAKTHDSKRNVWMEKVLI